MIMTMMKTSNNNESLQGEVRKGKEEYKREPLSLCLTSWCWFRFNCSVSCGGDAVVCCLLLLCEGICHLWLFSPGWLRLVDEVCCVVYPLVVSFYFSFSIFLGVFFFFTFFAFLDSEPMRDIHNYTTVHRWDREGRTKKIRWCVYLDTPSLIDCLLRLYEMG
jgi:hypothetical protein